MQNLYFDGTINQKVTKEMILDRGLPDDDEFLENIGIIKIECRQQDFDSDIEELAPYGDIFLDGDQYIQEFKTVYLPEETLQENLTSLIAEKRAEVLKKADESVQEFMSNFSEIEKSTWNQQQKEAEAYELDNSSPTPTLDSLASIRGIDRITMLQKTINKIKSFKELAPSVIGKQQKYEDEIKRISNDDNKPTAEKIKELKSLEFDFAKE